MKKKTTPNYYDNKTPRYALNYGDTKREYLSRGLTDMMTIVP